MEAINERSSLLASAEIIEDYAASSYASKPSTSSVCIPSASEIEPELGLEELYEDLPEVKTRPETIETIKVFALPGTALIHRKSDKVVHIKICHPEEFVVSVGSAVIIGIRTYVIGTASTDFTSKNVAKTFPKILPRNTDVDADLDIDLMSREAIQVEMPDSCKILLRAGTVIYSDDCRSALLDDIEATLTVQPVIELPRDVIISLNLSKNRFNFYSGVTLKLIEDPALQGRFKGYLSMCSETKQVCHGKDFIAMLYKNYITSVLSRDSVHPQHHHTPDTEAICISSEGTHIARVVGSSIVISDSKLSDVKTICINHQIYRQTTHICMHSMDKLAILQRYCKPIGHCQVIKVIRPSDGYILKKVVISKAVPVTAICFTPGGNNLIVGYGNSTVRTLNINTAELSMPAVLRSSEITSIYFIGHKMICESKYDINVFDIRRSAWNQIKKS